MCHNNIFIFGPLPDGGVSSVDGARAPVYNAVMGAEKDIALYGEYVGLDGTLIEASLAAYRANSDYCDRRIPRLTERFDRSLSDKNGAVKLACVLAAMKYSREKYRGFGIGDDVFADTFGDIAVWCRNSAVRNGSIGLDNYAWLSHHLRAELFRIGRLQFQFGRLYCPTGSILSAAKKLWPLRLGDKVLNVHVPQGGRLDADDCLDSFAAAEKFFARHFPTFGCKCFFIDSWLLGDINASLLPEGSNILAFASLFDVFAQTDSKGFEDAERIFDCKKRPISELDDSTSLRRAVKALLLSGGNLRRGFGTRYLR